MIDQSNITGRIYRVDELSYNTREHDVTTGKPIYLLFIQDEFIKAYKTHSAALAQMTKRLKKMYNDALYEAAYND
jgi:hypothetical protein